ncbi:sulfatase [Pararhizobium polonicum]|uniref:Sulfatase n=2 Tax=Pararhizobium polonicum TaxID=1612624 RepID=A0A1C7P139_9HYPH|nr:phosphoethanolamine--lipid A transferase [Pararhizobium polonicum]OBZ94947.1 sulfatase [Pararhizobium polonicum]
MGSVPLSLIVTLYILGALNFTFWNQAFSVFGGFNVSFYTFSAAIALLVVAGVVLFSAKYVIKPFLIFLIVAGAISSYYTDFFGVVIDKEMIRNAVVTTPQEASHLVTPTFVFHVLLYGVLPSLLVCWTKIRHRPLIGKLFANFVVISACLAVCVGLIISNYSGISSNIRQNREMMAKLTPFAPITSAIGLAVSTYREIGIVRAPLGTDARLGPVYARADKPIVTIIVAGETARAMNFSLNGYARETNPELKALDVVNYTKTTSCGTATAVSLPCMFSVYGRQSYSDRKARSTDTLMDVLRRAGIDGYWWDNNTGSKGIADLISFASLTKQKNSKFCTDGECQDDIFLGLLDAKLASITKNTVIVLHQLGSHGPTYYLRYPEEFRRFTPDCRTAQLSDCSREEIVNAYDNSILYTDHNLSEVIKLLKKHQGTVDGAMIYMSDHGESLGENGLFLHGAPYMFAPVEQTHVPFIAWFSDQYAQVMKLDVGCLRQYSDAPTSHDNLFHTVLGMMDVVTKVYRPELDVFAACRGAAPSGSPAS